MKRIEIAKDFYVSGNGKKYVVDIDATLNDCLKQINELKQKLARYENPDYVLVPRNSNNHIEDIMNEIIWDKGGFQIHREFNKIVYESMIEAVEKDHAQ